MGEKKTSKKAPQKKTQQKKESVQTCACAGSGAAVCQKKIKNLVAIAVLLGGVAAGSLFFDFGQLFGGGGFSQKALRDAKVVEHAGKTWVSYDDPKVTVRVYTAENCEDCITEEVVVWLRRIAPTVVVSKIEVSDSAARAAAVADGIKHIPAFVFSKNIDQTDFFVQAQILFDPFDEGYILRSAQLGIPVGQYLAAPSLENVISVGPDDAPVTIVEYSDFQCKFCKTVHPIVEQALTKYKDKVRYVYKHLPLPEHDNAVPAAIAAECAHQQEQFETYANILFARQDQWSKVEDNTRFEAYARELRLDGVMFATCLSDPATDARVQEDFTEALSFGIIDTPSLFVNEEFISGVVTLETLQKAIEAELAKNAPSGSAEETVQTN